MKVRDKRDPLTNPSAFQPGLTSQEVLKKIVGKGQKGLMFSKQKQENGRKDKY